MKRILFIVPSLGMGGMERVLVNYANLLTAKGHEVTVYNLTSHDNAIIMNLSKAVHYYSSYIPVPHILHCGLGDLIRLNFRILPMQKWINFHSMGYLHKKYIQDSFDVEVGFGGINTMKIVGGSKKAQTIGWIHGIHIENDVDIIGDYKKTQSIYNSMDKIICVSDLCKKSVKENYGISQNVYVLNNPNDSKRIRELSTEPLEVAKTEFTFITVARFIDEQKGFLRLLKVCDRLNNDGYKYNIWLVGDGPDFSLVKSRAEEMKLENVLFCGQQSNPYKYINNADMYLCASYTEGFSMVMMEAIILAKPMITTDVPGASEMLDNGKYGLIVENSENGLYQGMKKILSDQEEFVYYSKMADMRKDYLSEDTIIQQFETILSY